MANFLGDDDLLVRTDTRLPVVLCLDVSGSMYDCIDELNEGVKVFYDTIKKDEQASASCEIAIVTFSNGARLVEKFGLVSEKVPPTLQADGGTDMVAGLRLALEVLDNRKKEYVAAGRNYYQPWLVVMSDGAPNSYPTAEVEEIIQRQRNRKLTVFPFGIGDGADMDLMAKLSIKEKKLKIKDNNFAGLFEWLSKSAAIVSQSNPGDTGVKMDTTSKLDDFLDIDV